MKTVDNPDAYMEEVGVSDAEYLKGFIDYFNSGIAWIHLNNGEVLEVPSGRVTDG